MVSTKEKFGEPFPLGFSAYLKQDDRDVHI